jgi:hypothetical protein
MAQDRGGRTVGWVPWADLAGPTAVREAARDGWFPWSQIGTEADMVWSMAEKVTKPAPGMDAGRLDRATRPVAVAAQSAEIEIVELPVDAAIAEADALLPEAMTAIDDAIRVLRSVAVRDPRVAAALRQEGVSPDEVIGMVRSGGALTVIAGET